MKLLLVKIRILKFCNVWYTRSNYSI